MPAISSIRSPLRHRCIVRTIGMPPPTLPSKRKLTPLSLAMAKSSVPCAATSALLEVTTCFPAIRQAFVNGYAGFKPPIVSTTTATSGSSSMILKSWTILSSTGSPGKSRRSSTYFSATSCPQAAAICAAFSFKICATPEPIVPYPMIAVCTISISSLFVYF